MTNLNSNFDPRTRVANAYDPRCPGCASGEYHSHEAAPYRYHVTSSSHASEGVYHLVKLNCPGDAESHLNVCDCEWGTRRDWNVRHRGEILHACRHIVCAADLHSRGLKRYPRITDLPKVEGEVLVIGEQEYELWDGDEVEPELVPAVA